MLTHKCMDVGGREDVQMSRELRLIQDIAPVLGLLTVGLMGLFGMPPLLDAE